MKRLVRAGVIAAVYVALCVVLQPISYGVIQLRIAEAMTVLPILYREAVLAIFVGVLLANIYGGLGIADIVVGSLTSLVAAYLTYVFRNSWAAYLPPILLNAFIVSIYLHILLNFPYWATVLSIGVSQTIVVFGLGYPLIRYLRRYEEKKSKD
ncbi:MAG: QueT transporter family protein [Clostridia bacterium]|nr:QueT transporter family protein [Clostridia bacterium]